MATKFEADIKEHATLTELDMLNVARQSIQDVVRIAQTPKAKGGRMPVITSFLRNSLASGLNGAFGPPSGDSYVLTIAQLKLSDVAQFGWTAAYARRVELGFVGTDSLGRGFEQQGAFFMGSAADQWEELVRANAAKVQS